MTVARGKRGLADTILDVLSTTRDALHMKLRVHNQPKDVDEVAARFLLKQFARDQHGRGDTVLILNAALAAVIPSIVAVVGITAAAQELAVRTGRGLATATEWVRAHDEVNIASINTYIIAWGIAVKEFLLRIRRGSVARS